MPAPEEMVGHNHHMIEKPRRNQSTSPNCFECPTHPRTDSRIRIGPIATPHVERVADEVALAAQTPHGVQRVVRGHEKAPVARQVREQPEFKQ